MARGLEVTIARPDERPALANLMQFYIHDFSEFFAGTARGELEDDGRFEDYPLDDYWRDPANVPLLLRVDGRMAGFALLDAGSHSGRPVDRNMAEFFIARKHRRGGVGLAAARIIFTRWPGVWEAAVARRNTAALAFWRKAIRGHPLAEDVEESDLTTKAWNGWVLRFRARGA